MKNKIYCYLPAIMFGVLVVSFLAAFYILAWTEPSEAPPGGNVPAPINVGSVDQIKQGSLSLNTAGISPTGLIVNRDAIFLNGNVGIGDTSPDSGTGGQLKLDVEGPVGATKYCDENGNNCKTITEIGAGGFVPNPYNGEQSITFPNGLIMKMGYIPFAGAWTSVTFSATFPNSLVSVSILSKWGGVTGDELYEPSIRNESVSGFQIFNYWETPAGFYWQAWGY